MRSFWWGVMAGVVLLSQFVLVSANPSLLVPPIYWVMGIVGFIGHLWLWLYDDVD